MRQPGTMPTTEREAIEMLANTPADVPTLESALRSGDEALRRMVDMLLDPEMQRRALTMLAADFADGKAGPA